MKFVGHTKGTPDLTIVESISLFSKMGLDGIEIVCREGAPFSQSTSEKEIKEMMKSAEENRLEIVTLTPYMGDINSADKDISRKNIQGLKDCLLLAKKMGAKFVRSFGGKEVKDNKTGAWERSVSALKEVGIFARECGVTIVVENHHGTMTATGQDTTDLIRQVNLPNVRALYDPANVLYTTDEPWEKTLNLQKNIIGHVHVKDFYIKNGERIACIVGKGAVPWDKILLKLREIGYDGYLSFEYEIESHQLPEAKEGVAKSLQYLKEVLK